MNQERFSKRKLFENNATLLLRIWTGLIFIRYGLSVWHQANMIDFAATLKTVNIPYPVLSGYLCKSTEFMGGIFLLVGLLKRFAGIFLIIDMTVATFVFHRGLLLQNGMTTFLLLICCLTLLLSVPDKLSIDWFIYKNKRIKHQNQ